MIRYTKLNYLFIVFYLIWLPFQLLVLRLEGMGIIIVGISVIVFILNLMVNSNRLKKVFQHNPISIWAILVLYSFINWSFKQPTFASISEYLSFVSAEFISPFIFLCVLRLMLDYNHKTTTIIVCGALVFYMVLGVLNLSRFEGDERRMLVEGIGNLLPLNAFVCFGVTLLLGIERRIDNKLLVLIGILAFAVIILGSTRKALGASVILIIGYILSLSKMARAGKFKSIVLLIILGLALNYTLDNSSIGERISSTGDIDFKLVENSGMNKVLISVLGDRAYQYDIAFRIFPDNPITGIGIRNFESYSGFSHRLHTEYMVQLCENGIIGFSLLLVFYYLLVRGLNKRKRSDPSSLFLLFFLISLLFIDLTAWTYNTTFGMVIYALLTEKIAENRSINYAQSK